MRSKTHSQFWQNLDRNFIDFWRAGPSFRMVITIQSLHLHVSESDRFFNKTNSKNSSKLGPKSTKNQSKIGSKKHPKNISKLDPKMTPKWTPNCSQNRPKIDPGTTLGSEMCQRCSKRAPNPTNYHWNPTTYLWNPANYPWNPANYHWNPANPPAQDLHFVWLLLYNPYICMFWPQNGPQNRSWDHLGFRNMPKMVQRTPKPHKLSLKPHPNPPDCSPSNTLRIEGAAPETVVEHTENRGGFDIDFGLTFTRKIDPK